MFSLARLFFFVPFAFFYKQVGKNKLDETYWRQILLQERGTVLFPAFKVITKLYMKEREVIRPILDILKEWPFSGFLTEK